MSANFIQKLFTSRDNNITSAEYVGDQDRLWYDPVTNTLRVWNGMPGGIPVLGSGGPSLVNVEENGVVKGSVSNLNFLNANISVSGLTANIITTSGGNISILSQGVSITNAVSSINFVGDGVTSVALGSEVTVTIPGGGTGGYYILNGGAPDQVYICGPLPAKIGFEWDGGNCIDLGSVA